MNEQINIEWTHIYTIQNSTGLSVLISEVEVVVPAPARW